MTGDPRSGFEDGTGGHSLSPADAAAFDELIRCEFDLHAVAEPHRTRASEVLRLLGGLNEGPVPGSVDAQVLAIAARVAAVPASDARDDDAPVSGWVQDHSGLSEPDTEALEALVAHRFDPSQVTSGMRERATGQARLLSLLSTPAAAVPDGNDREALIRRTLGLIEAEVDGQSVRMRVEPEPLADRRWRLADFASIAAVLVLGSIILTPLISTARQNQMKAACSSNYSAAGFAFASYAGDFRDSMPLASASTAGTPWWNVGKPEQSNSANLYTLASSGYVSTLDPLTCPSCDAAPRGECFPGARDWTCIDEVSYSFQNLFSTTRPRWQGPERMVVLADRSPITRGSIKNQAQNPFMNSPNHRGSGQNVLFNDGSAKWITDPVSTSGDNIWLPRDIEVHILAQEWANRTGRPVILIGREEPGAPGNVFLGP
ncbi:MAG: hypothetical protein AB7K52_05960 [Phycisphaerales bacterium]